MEDYYMKRANFTSLFIAFLIVGYLLVPIESVSQEAEVMTVPVYQVFDAEVTAYTASEDETDSNPNENASGQVPKIGDIACPSRFKFGTKVIIRDKEYVCADRMSRKYRDGNYFDVLVQTKREAFHEWGREVLTIKVYR